MYLNASNSNIKKILTKHEPGKTNAGGRTIRP